MQETEKKHCQRRECCWSVVQLDYDGKLGPMHGVYGAMDAELEVQRAIKKAELTAFLCPPTCMLTTKVSLEGC